MTQLEIANFIGIIINAMVLGYAFCLLKEIKQTMVLSAEYYLAAINGHREIVFRLDELRKLKSPPKTPDSCP